MIGSLKIDVEGMEDQALIPFLEQAPKSLLPKCMVLEHGHQEQWKLDLFQALKEAGYETTFKNRGNTILRLTAE